MKSTYLFNSGKRNFFLQQLRDFLIGITGGGVAEAAAKLFKLQKRYNEYARAGFQF